MRPFGVITPSGHEYYEGLKGVASDSTGASATSAIVSIPAALGQDTLAAGVRTSRYMRILIHY